MFSLHFLIVQPPNLIVGVSNLEATRPPMNETKIWYVDLKNCQQSINRTSVLFHL